MIYILSCWYTDWVGEQSPFHNTGSYLIYLLSVLIHWLARKTITVSNSGFYLIYITSVTIHWLDWRSLKLAFHHSGSYMIYILSCWYADWVAEPSEFHPSGSYLIYISSVSIHWLGWRSLRVSSQWFFIPVDLYIVFVDTLIGLENHQRFITVGLTWSTYRLCRYTDKVGEALEFHHSGSYLIFILSVLIHWLGWRTITVSSQWFLLDLHFLCVDTLIGLENNHRFITVVLTWATYCRVDTLIALENHHRFITVVLTWSSFFLCWYTDWVGEQSPFYNRGSYLSYILSCWYTDWVGEPSEFHNCGFYLIYILSVLIHWWSWRTIRVS